MSKHDIESNAARYLAALHKIRDWLNSDSELHNIVYLKGIIDDIIDQRETLIPQSVGNNIFEFSVAGVPQAQLRPRVVRRGSRIVLYDEAKCVKAKRKVAREAVRVYGDKTKINTPVHVDITFHMPIPKGLVKSTRIGDPHVKRPDLDNLVKLVLDGITDSKGIWFDDNQVVAISARKVYANLVCTDVVIRY